MKRKKGPLGKLRQKMLRMEAERARTVAQSRKEDARHKIQLGGLIIKAGLGDEDTLILFGALVELADGINKPGERDRLMTRGRKAFFS